MFFRIIFFCIFATQEYLKNIYHEKTYDYFINHNDLLRFYKRKRTNFW